MNLEPTIGIPHKLSRCTNLPVPHPNAYDEYVQAANQLVGDVGDAQQLDLVSFRALVGVGEINVKP